MTENGDRLERYAELAVRVGANVSLATFYGSRGRYDLATSRLEEALRAEPHLVGLKLALADLYIRSGKYEQAMSTAREILRVNPRAVEAAFTKWETMQNVGR